MHHGIAQCIMADLERWGIMLTSMHCKASLQRKFIDFISNHQNSLHGCSPPRSLGGERSPPCSLARRTQIYSVLLSSSSRRNSQTIFHRCVIHFSHSVRRKTEDVDKLPVSARVHKAIQFHHNTQICRKFMRISLIWLHTDPSRFFAGKVHGIHRNQEVRPPEPKSKGKYLFIFFPEWISGQIKIFSW